MSTIREYVKLLDDWDLSTLWDESLEWDEVGVLPEDALARWVLDVSGMSSFSTSTVLLLSVVFSEVWRELAVRSRPTGLTSAPSESRVAP